MNCASWSPCALRLALVLSFGGLSIDIAVARPQAMGDEAPAVRTEVSTGGFWENKPKLIRAMHEDRRIVVSSKVERVFGREASQGADQDHFQIQGAGWVKAGLEQAFSVAQDYARLPEVSEHFRKVEWQADKSELFLAMSALGYVAEMKLTMRTRETPTERELSFEVIEGHFLGLKGKMLFTPKLQGQVTQIALFVDHRSPEVPLPRALMGVVLEAIAEKVAQRMRRHIEGTTRPKSAQLPTKN